MDWLRFTNPTEEPDARVEKDMNTFISLMKDAPVKDLKDAIEQIGHIIKVASTVNDVWSQHLAEFDFRGQIQAMKTLDTLKEIVLEKLDLATVRLLRFVDTLLVKSELNIEEVVGSFSVGMWANYNDMRPIRKSVQLERVGVYLDIPKQLLAQNEKFVYRLIRMPISSYNFGAYSSTANNESMTKFIVGDVITFDILLSAPAAFYLRAKQWTIRDRSASSVTLRRSHYPSSVACRMLLKVPDNIVMTEDIRAAVWNEDLKDWTEDGISDFQYNEANRTAQFYITTVGTLALVKSRTADLPYKSWLLAPVHGDLKNKDVFESLSFEHSKSSIYPPMYEKHARFTIQTQKHELVIDIMGSKCMLVQPDTKNFSDIIGKIMSPGAILSNLQRKGINLMPTPLEQRSVEGFNAKV